MFLADSFSDDLRSQFLDRQIIIGSAVAVKVDEFVGINYDKFGIYFANDTLDVSKCGLVIINSPTPIIENNRKVRSEHVAIDCARHDFLTHDSYVHCGKIIGFETEVLKDYIKNNPDKLLGNVADDVMDQIYKTLLNSKKLSLSKKKQYYIIK